MDIFWGFDRIVALNFSLSSEHFAVCHFLSIGENSVIGFGGDIVVISRKELIICRKELLAVVPVFLR